MNECSSSSRLEIFIRKLKHRHCVYKKVSGLGHSSRIRGEGGAENIQGKAQSERRGGLEDKIRDSSVWHEKLLKQIYKIFLCIDCQVVKP